MALAERLLAARFGRSLVDHRTWVIASDGDMMEGISHEAAAIAGHLCLSKLTVLYDDNHISIDGDTALAYSDDVLKRFSAYGWAAKRIDGHDPQQINAALSFAIRSKKPTADRVPHDHRTRRPHQGGHGRHPRLAARCAGGSGGEGGARLARAGVHRAGRSVGALAHRREPGRRQPAAPGSSGWRTTRCAASSSA